MQTLRRDLFQMYFHELTLQISLAEFPTQRFGHTIRNKSRVIPAEPGDFPYDTRAEISIFLVWHQEYRFNCGIQISIHQRHLKFEFKIRNCAQTSNHGSRVLSAGEFDQQPAKLGDADVLDSTGGLSQ